MASQQTVITNLQSIITEQQEVIAAQQTAIASLGVEVDTAGGLQSYDTAQVRRIGLTSSHF